MKKTVSEATDSVANGEDDLSLQDASSKKRGRPKAPEGSAKKPKVDSEGAPKSGRGRGRPPKPGGPTVKPKKPVPLDADGNPIKRGRGRPRKDEKTAPAKPAESKKKAAARDDSDESS